MSLNKENTDELRDDQDIIIIDHLVSREVDTNTTLVNQRGSTVNIQDDNNEE